MTYAEWREKWPAVDVKPYPDAPDVLCVSGRDPLHHGGPRTWDAPLAALFQLDDYHVTSSNVYRGYIYLAPKVERDDWTRKDYMQSRCSHDQYYSSLARLIGLPGLIRLVGMITTKEQIIAAGEHLNKIPLAKWDRMHESITHMISEQNRSKGIMARSWDTTGTALPPRTICWSLSESVCVAKAAARLWAAQPEPAAGVEAQP